jgi:murein DD-endopeptidase MepM/ murein hydrolase activator NlpD
VKRGAVVSVALDQRHASFETEAPLPPQDEERSYLPSSVILILRSAVRHVSKDAWRLCQGSLSILFLLLALCLTPAIARAVELVGKFIQGGLVLGTIAPGATVALDGRAVPVSPEGRFVFGFGRDATEAVLTLTLPDGTREENRLTIEKRDYDIQRVDGVPQNTVTPDPDELARIKREAAAVRALRDVASAENFFTQPMIWPAMGPISGVYGSQRILNGEPRAPHMGVDVAAPAGSPIVAAADGVVRMAETLFLTGNTILIDHGYGLETSYAHLSRLDVKPGQRVRQGEQIGLLGATGRVTGPHLHWGMEWFEVRLDPQLVVGPMPAQ